MGFQESGLIIDGSGLDCVISIRFHIEGLVKSLPKSKTKTKTRQTKRKTKP